MKLRLVCISWVDAEEESGWSKDDPDAKETIIKTYGLLVRRDKKWVVHANTYCPDTPHPWGGRGKIPAGMVRSVKTITTVEV